MCALTRCYQVFRHNKLRSFLQDLSIHLVEASPPLSDIQHETVLATPTHAPQPLATHPTHTPLPYKTSRVDNVDVCWYRQLKDVPQGKTTSTNPNITTPTSKQDMPITSLMSFLMLFLFISSRYVM